MCTTNEIQVLYITLKVYDDLHCMSTNEFKLGRVKLQRIVPPHECTIFFDALIYS